MKCRQFEHLINLLKILGLLTTFDTRIKLFIFHLKNHLSWQTK